MENGIEIQTKTFVKETMGPGDMIDLTPDATALLRESGLKEGTAVFFNIGSTAGITTIEYEPGLKKDMAELYQRLIPQGPDYHHHATWGDQNGSSHLRASLQGPSLAVPFKDGVFLLGTWQQPVLLEFDDRPRRRKIVIQFMGFR